MQRNITRHFGMIGERRVHFRRAGEGPPVILLHQSPRSSSEHVAMMAGLADRFTVIAPDTPGFGQSDPISAPDDEPGIDAFVDALAGLLDLLGIEKAGVYGTHSGAILGVRLAARYPERVSALVANGVLLTTQAERTALLDQYFRPFVPAWDGSHLVWLWMRLRDQLRFYPWYNRSGSARIDWQMSLEDIHASSIDLLAAGDHYRSGYRAVLDYGIEQDLVRLAVPTRVIMVEADALYRYLSRFPDMPECVEVQSVPGFADAFGPTRAFLEQHPGSSPTIAEPLPGPMRLVCSSFDRNGSALHVRGRAGKGAAPIVLLHPIGGSASALQPLIEAFPVAQPVHAPDLPGHGQSEPPDAGTGIEGVVRRLGAWLDTLPDRVRLVAIGDAALLGARLAASSTRVAELILCDSPAEQGSVSAAPLPNLEPNIDGTHLLAIWSYLKDRVLYLPWNDRSRDAFIEGAEPPSPLVLQHQLRDLLLAGEAIRPLIEDVNAADIEASLAALSCPIRWMATPGRPGAEDQRLPSVMRDWAPFLR